MRNPTVQYEVLSAYLSASHSQIDGAAAEKGLSVKNDADDYPVEYLWYVLFACLAIAVGATLAVFALL